MIFEGRFVEMGGVLKDVRSFRKKHQLTGVRKLKNENAENRNRKLPEGTTVT